MLILIKSTIKTTFFLLLFTAGVLNLYAKNPIATICQNVDTIKTITAQEEQITIPDQLAKIPINFRINANINYLNFDHFIRLESKKMFIQAWLKEKELQRLSINTDSLRNVYANTSAWQKEEVSSLILKAEEKAIALNEEIRAMYEKAREEEDLYWKAVPAEEVVKFQEKISMYSDSINSISEKQTQKTANNHPEIRDTIVLLKPAIKTSEISATEPSGIIYKIQVGAYKSKIPEPANKLLKKISMIRKVEKYIDDKGVSIYTTGNLKLYKEAITMQNQVKQEGVKNAVITAYQNGKKITVNEARKLNNEL